MELRLIEQRLQELKETLDELKNKEIRSYVVEYDGNKINVEVEIINAKHFYSMGITLSPTS